jgi:antitoxin HigA-1
MLNNKEKRKEITEDDLWNADKTDGLKAFIAAESAKQSPEQQLRNEFLAIRYQMQDYIEQNKVKKGMRLLDFVKQYLSVLGLTQKELASGFGMKDTNLYKYLIGERKLNSDIALKLGSFSHTPPELWYSIQIKNELLELGQAKIKEYEKYDYKNLMAAH